MTETRWLDEHEATAWRGYQEMSARLAAHLHRSLIRRTGLSLSDYEVLMRLSESADDRLRAFELGSAMQWEKSRLSHHLTRMQSRGLVDRQVCETDGRGLFILLTPKGRKAVENAAPHHVADVRERLVDLLTPEELSLLAGISQKVLSSFDAEDESLCDDPLSEIL